MTTGLQIIIVFLFMSILGACQQRMGDQPKYEELEASPIFSHNQAALHPPAYTIDSGQLEEPNQPPVNITLEDLQRGQQRYRIYCVPCHGELGDGSGPVVVRGFPAPPSYHLNRLRQASLRHFYQVISEGYGVMYSYADRITAEDRWRIALYIRALQFSQPTQTEIRSPVAALQTNTDEISSTKAKP